MTEASWLSERYKPSLANKELGLRAIDMTPSLNLKFSKPARAKCVLIGGSC